MIDGSLPAQKEAGSFTYHGEKWLWCQEIFSKLDCDIVAHLEKSNVVWWQSWWTVQLETVQKKKPWNLLAINTVSPAWGLAFTMVLEHWMERRQPRRILSPHSPFGWSWKGGLFICLLWMPKGKAWLGMNTHTPEVQSPDFKNLWYFHVIPIAKPEPRLQSRLSTEGKAVKRAWSISSPKGISLQWQSQTLSKNVRELSCVPPTHPPPVAAWVHWVSPEILGGIPLGLD